MMFAGQRVVFVGDSHGEVLGPLLRTALLQRGATVPLVLANRGWSTSRYVASGELDRMRGARPDLVIYELGGNDGPVSAQAYAPALRAAVGAARAAGAREIVWIGPARTAEGATPDTAVRHENNALYQESLLPQMAVRWIDSRRHTYGGHGRDGVHFSRAGYEAWAYGILDDLTESASSPSIGLGLLVIGLGALGAYGLVRWLRRR